VKKNEDNAFPYEFGDADASDLPSLDPAYNAVARQAAEDRTWVTWQEYGGSDEIEFLKGRRWE